ncbi:sulfotransferase [Sphingomonas sp. CROZ-RG-20F-R02-07]|uniref:sulfotransferase n=1 Tax=Sphingomonas sp. CROZ-RG-20F-R02-07 TaxID=2914832 RepID=UPI001F573E35|nr:sulfotransferase [Sphingomonas sp. CROZ-RG-20F-R02-07]
MGVTFVQPEGPAPRHLLHVGLAKAGSTLLQQWFAAHSQLRYRIGGIAGFSSTSDMMFADASTARPAWYVTSEEGLASPYDGSSTLPIAERRKQVCATLKDLFSNAKVLIVTRGYRGMILSSYSQYVRTGGEAPLEAVAADAAETGVWHYDALVALYRRAFGQDAVIVMPYELLRDDPRRFADLLADRLQIDRCALPTGWPNRSLTPIELRWYPWMSRKMRQLPLPGPLKRPIASQYAKAVFDNRLARPIRLLQRLIVRPPVVQAGDALVARFIGQADGLASDPLYRAYAAEYLFGDA